jgi:hypothetical protein
MVQNRLLKALVAQVVPGQPHHQHQMGQLLLRVHPECPVLTPWLVLAGHRNCFMRNPYFKRDQVQTERQTRFMVVAGVAGGILGLPRPIEQAAQVVPASLSSKNFID